MTARPAALRHRRLGRRRQVARSSGACCTTPRRSSTTSSSTSRPRARRGDGELDLALLDRRPARRARAGHHDRRRLPLLRDRRGARFIIADTPGHVQYTRNMVTGASTADLARRARRRAPRRGRADHAPRVHRVAARDPAHRRRGQQDGPRRLLRGALRRDRRASSRAFRAQLARRATSPSSRSARCTATTSSSAPTQMPWYGGPPLLEHLEHVEVADRPQPRRPALPGPVGDPRRRAATTAATPARSPAASLRPRRRGRGAAERRATRDRGDRHLRRRARRGVPADVGDACAWPTTSTSRAATSSAAADDAPGAGARARGRRLLDGRRARCAPAARYAIKHTTHTRAGDRRRDRATSSTSTRSSARPAPDRAGAQRHRPRAPAHRQAARLRPLRAQPRHRLVHPHRRGHERHRRRGDDHGALAPNAPSDIRSA